MPKIPPPLIDIGSNLNDPVFRAVYGGRQIHANDFEAILNRARKAGINKQILTGDCLIGSKEVIELANAHDGLYATVGCHPCRANEFDSFEAGPNGYYSALESLIAANLGNVGGGGKGKVVAIGECGLGMLAMIAHSTRNYDRLEHCDKETQLKYFPVQLNLATKFDLPLFLHSRAAHSDFVAVIKNHPSKLRGVVHSFTGSIEESLELISLGFFIGINGCSLKSASNLECVQQLPLESILIESDCPWCEIRPSHASFPFLATLKTSEIYSELHSLYLPPAVKKERFTEGKMVKGRNEPVATGQVAWIIAQVKGIEFEVVTSACWRNTVELFGL